MNIEKAKIWVSALRSGKYKQCRKTMCTKDAFCCLGVAHEALIGPTNFHGSYIHVATELDIHGQMWEFIDMNDLKKMSFDQIADEIEKRIAFEENVG